MKIFPINYQAYYRKYRSIPSSTTRSTFCFELIADGIEIETVIVKNSPYFAAVKEAQKAAAAADAESINLVPLS